jgi:predicted site-specific integrase-resolvase
MKLSEYAKKIGVSYRTAWNYFRAGKLNAYQTHTGTVIVREEDKPTEGKVAVYCRVSSSENKTNLESQKKRLLDYAAARGYQVSKVITEVGSGINDTRKQWLSLLQDRSIRLIGVEQKERFTKTTEDRWLWFSDFTSGAPPHPHGWGFRAGRLR